jgi:quercetin 2,3-dioxygenase
MEKKVSRTSNLKFTQDFPGLKGVNIMARDFPIEPFLVFTEYLMDKPVFGPHPHAGISVMTYMLPDSKQGFINRDSNGDFSYVEPGGLHITQAGSGIHHDEFPKTTGMEAHGFQIWVNHTEVNRWVEPKAIHAKASEILEVKTSDYKVRVVHGNYNNTNAAYKMVTDVTLLHIFLNPNASIQLDAKEMAFAYGLNGVGEADGENILPQTLLNFDGFGNDVIVKASASGLEFMFGTGVPLNEQIPYGGPFVMTTPEQMRETQKRYASGKMGTLKPYQP